MKELSTLLESIVDCASSAPSLYAFRVAAIELLLSRVPADGAMFHALSPRVPLETAAFVGLDMNRVLATVPRWDQLTVDLGALRDAALKRGGVATDREAFPLGSKGRKRFDREIVRHLRMKSLAGVHLIVRGAVRSIVLLFRKSPDGFAAEELALLRAVAPALGVGDALHIGLDGVVRSAVPVRMECRDQRLTPRQRQIIEYVALGHTNASIARAMGLSVNTLRNHLADAFRRLAAANRADAVRLAVLQPVP
jgi:DNA-binding CsgD family transcriptional regulator